MSVLNRPLFRRPSAMPPSRGPMPVVNREKGSSEKGEESIASKLMEALSNIVGKAEPSTSSQKESDINFYRDKGYNDAEITLILNGLLNPMEFDPGVFTLNFDMEAAVNEGKLIRKGDPNSVVREGELSPSRSVVREGELLPNDYSVLREGEKINPSNYFLREGELMPSSELNYLKNLDPNSVVREGELSPSRSVVREGEMFPGFAMGGETNGLEELSRMRFRQEGSPMMGEQVDAGNVGILDGFSEQQASAMVQEGEQSKAQIDGAQNYDELMKSTRGDNASEEERRDELAQLVGEEDAQQTPDSVLALIQPVMQMLETEAADTGIAQVEGQNIPPEMMGTGIAQFAEGGAVLKIPKYSNGTGSSGVSVEEEQGFGMNQSTKSDGTIQYPETASFLLGMINDMETPLGTGNQAIMDKYEDNYKLFSEILGGQGPSKDQMIGEILTSVVSPLAFAYAQGADLKDILPQGTAAIGKIAKNYDALSSKQTSQIKNLALTEAMKTKEDPLMQVYLRDNPETPDVNESLQKVFRRESEVLANPSLFTAESIADLEAKIAKTTAETDKLKTETALSEVELKYADIFADLKVTEQNALIDGQKINNAIQEVMLEFKPETLTAELKKINLSNIEQSITNDTLRPKLEAELETTLVQLDIATENLKQEIVVSANQEELAKLDINERQAKIDQLIQEYDFDKENNVLLLEQKKAEIDNIILTSKNLDLENEFKTIENKFAEGKFTKEDEIRGLEIISLQQDNARKIIENEYLPQEKKLNLDKINEQILVLQEEYAGQVLVNEKNEIELNNYEVEKELNLNKLRLQNEKLEYDLKNPPKDWQATQKVVDFKNKWIDSVIYKSTAERQNMLQELYTAADDNTGASDISFIFRYMKFLDPNSVVREGEFATAAEAGGVPQKFVILRDKIMNGAILTEKIKNDFLQVASKMYVTQLDNYKKQYDIESAIAGRLFGEDQVENAIPNLSFDESLLERIVGKDEINKYLQSLDNS